MVPLHGPRVVADLMASEPIVVHADSGLPEAALLMDRHGISGLPVVDAAGLLVGVISESDLLRARATEHLWASRDSLRVRNLMTSPALTVRRDEPLAQAARRMDRHRVSRLVVVDDDPSRPVGIIAVADLVRAMAADSGVDESEGDGEVADGPGQPAVPAPAPVDGDGEGD